MKLGDRVLIKADRVPGTDRIIPAGTIGTVVSLIDAADGIIEVRAPEIRGDDSLPPGSGWPLSADSLVLQ